VSDPPTDTRKPLLASRVVEQGTIGIGALLLARAAGVEGFAAPSAILVFNSLAVTLADLGLGTDVLRLGPHEFASRRRLRSMRQIDVVGAVLATAVGASLGGDARVVAIGAGVMWFASAESYVRRSGAIRKGAIRSVVAGEIGGSVVLAGAFAFACASPDQAPVALVIGFVAKSVVESMSSRRWQECFSAEGVVGDQLALWLAQVVAFAIANLDFVAVSLLLGAPPFAVYALAFRLSNAAPSQLAYVAGRTASVDLAARPHERDVVYRRYFRPLFAMGLIAAIGTALAAPLLPRLLAADEWDSITGVLLVLAVAIPWRMVLGLGGTLMIVARRADLLLRVECVHVVFLAGALFASGSAGFGPLVAVAAGSTVVSVLAYHHTAARVTEARLPRAAIPAAVASLVCVGALAASVSLPG
jgi:O-antigen/teichoic acid export membrane protein